LEAPEPENSGNQSYQDYFFDYKPNSVGNSLNIVNATEKSIALDIKHFNI
jgi:hypothetical protein